MPCASGLSLDLDVNRAGPAGLTRKQVYVHKILCKLSQPSLAIGHGLVHLSYSGLCVSGALGTSDQWAYAHPITRPSPAPLL